MISLHDKWKDGDTEEWMSIFSTESQSTFFVKFEKTELTDRSIVSTERISTLFRIFRIFVLTLATLSHQ